MMQQEFERIAGYEVSTEDYNNIIDPMYMASSLSKEEFVKTINKKRFAIKKEVELKPVFVSNGTRTPNGCYYIGKWMMQIGQPDTNIGTGKTTFKVRETTFEEQREIGWDSYLAYTIDIWSGNPNYIIKTK